MLKLEQRELPTVVFRRDLPEFLAKGPCFIEFEARAGGAINTAYGRAVEQMTTRANVLDAKRAEITDAEARVKQRTADAEEVGELRLMALYDACVIKWRSNILSDGLPITCDRETFGELIKVKGVPELAAALLDLEREVLSAGVIVKQEQDATVKN